MAKRMGGGLVAVAGIAQSELTAALSTSYPPASKEGEFPHGRTWNLRSAVMYEPTKPIDAGRKNAIRIGYSIRAAYGAILELLRGRLGLNEILKRIKPRIDGLLAKVTGRP